MSSGPRSAHSRSRARRRWACVFAVVAACASRTPRHTPAPLPPTLSAVTATPAAERPIDIAETPPFRLPHSFEPLGYQVRLALGEHDFTGHIEITAEVHEELSLIWLHGVDLTVTHAVAQGDKGEVLLRFSAPRNDQTLGFRPVTPLSPGRWTLAVDYRGRILDEPARTQPLPHGMQEPWAEGLFRRDVDGAAYFFTQGEAIDARRIFPCIDEPDRKVPWQLTLDIRKGLVAAANTSIASETPIDRDHVRVAFAPSRPLPSYLVAFAVGPFDVVTAKPSSAGVPIRILALHGRSASVARATAVAPQLLDLLVKWLNVPYAYGKLDVVEVPRSGWGAMENPGLVTVSEPSLEHWTTPILAHEFAHLWFGDLVTPAWWDDLWLNESFATFFADEVERALDPHAPLEDEVEDRAQGFESYWASARRPILANEQLAGGTFEDWMAVRSGVSALHLARSALGRGAFMEALHEYLVMHADANVRTEDLVAALTGHAASSDIPFGRALLESNVATLGFELSCKGRPHVVVSNRFGKLRVCVAYDRDGSRAEACDDISPDHTSIDLPARACPRWVLPNSGGTQLFRTSWSTSVARNVVDVAWPHLTPAERRAVFHEMDDAPLKLRAYTKLASTLTPDEIPGEADYLQSIANMAPDDLKPRFAAWVETRFGARARQTHFAVTDGDSPSAMAMQSVLRLVASIEDSDLAKDAVALAGSYHDWRPDFPFAESVWMLAASRDATIADELLDQLTKKDPKISRWQLRQALANSSGTLPAFERDPERLTHFDSDDLMVLLGTQCDPGARARVAKLGNSESNSRVTGALARIDACIKERKKVDPEFRAWLGAAAQKHAH